VVHKRKKREEKKKKPKKTQNPQKKHKKKKKNRKEKIWVCKYQMKIALNSTLLPNGTARDWGEWKLLKDLVTRSKRGCREGSFGKESYWLSGMERKVGERVERRDGFMGSRKS